MQITPIDAKYCDCVLEVAAEQPGQCNLEKAWFQHRDGRECYNPYAVCHRTIEEAHNIDVGNPPCDMYYDYEHLPTEQLIAFANLKGIPARDASSREHLISMIDAYLSR